MKTPMQELFYTLKERVSSLKEMKRLTQPLSSPHRILQTQIEELKQILLFEDEFIKKEKEVIINAYEVSHISMMTAQQYYNETFNTKER